METKRIFFTRRTFVIFNYIFCITAGILCLLPLLNVLAISFSSKEAVMSGTVGLVPISPSLESYRFVLKDKQFFRSFGISVVRTVLSLVVHMLLTILAAYPLSMTKAKMRSRNIYVWIFMIANIFSGGLIPTYLVVTSLGLKNTIWALILPGAVPIGNVILLQNFMKSLPDEMAEAAAIDGAGHFRTLFQITLPLCLPCLATLCLFVTVGSWNAWFDGMIYIDKIANTPFQTYLRSVIVEVSAENLVLDEEELAKMVSSGGSNAAKIFIAMVPILIFYPFAQKYFVKGIVAGSVKG